MLQYVILTGFLTYYAGACACLYLCQRLGLKGSVFDVFGKSYLAFIFCTDVTTEIIAYISHGDDSDGPLMSATATAVLDPRELRQKEMTDIGTLRGGSVRKRYAASGVSAWTGEVAPSSTIEPELREPPKTIKPPSTV